MSNEPRTEYRPLLEAIDSFQAAYPITDSYLGKKATGNSEVVTRLRRGGSVYSHTEANIRAFIAENWPEDVPQPQERTLAHE